MFIMQSGQIRIRILIEYFFENIELLRKFSENIDIVWYFIIFVEVRYLLN